MNVSGYSGDAGDSLQYEGDWDGNAKFGSYYNNRMKFTTRHRDNDNFRGNCARGRGGGWWYNACFWACLTCNRDNHQWWTVGKLANSRMMIKPQ